MAESKMVEESDGVDLSIFDSHAMTSRSISHYRFKWTLKDFSRLPLPIESALFKLLPGYECSLELGFYVNSTQMYCLNKPKSTSTSLIEWKVTVYDCNGKSLFRSAENTNAPFSGSLHIGNKTNMSLLDDIMIIICDYTIHAPTKSEICNFQQPSVFEYSSQEKLSADLKTMYEKHQNADVTLRTEDEDVLAHKSILSARSPVFEKMFEHQMKEAEQNIVPVCDVKIPALKKLMDFLYSGTVEAEEDVEATYALYYAADKYEVLDLRKMCADTMRSKITVENAIQLAIWADRHEDEFLKTSVLDFISFNLNSITDSDDWESFVCSESKLAAQITKHCITKRIGLKSLLKHV